MDLNANFRASRVGVPYTQRPGVAAIVALGLYAGVFTMRLMIHGTDPITVFYIFPVALLAMTFGSRAGVAAGIVAVLLIVAWGAIDGVAANPVGWIGRVAPIMLLGFLVGRATDRLRAAAQTRQALFAAQLREREAAEINDSVIQGLAAAKWSIEAGQIERGLDALTDTIATTESLVAALLRNQPLPQGSDPARQLSVPASSA
jgi:energy-coupling factor transporter transmembrane protein EcfT